MTFTLLDLFFPLAFFVFTLSVAMIVISFLVLDQAARLTWQVQRVLGVWFGVFTVALAGMIVLLLGMMLSGHGGSAAQPDGSFGAGIQGPLLLAWIAAFFVVTVAGAYFLLFLWSSETSIEENAVTRRLAIGRDVITKDTLEKVIEVVFIYWPSNGYRPSNGPGRLRSRSFFVFVAQGRGPLFRHALFRPPSALAEDEFRNEIQGIAPLAVAVMPWLPRIPLSRFHLPFSISIEGQQEK